MGRYATGFSRQQPPNAIVKPNKPRRSSTAQQRNTASTYASGWHRPTRMSMNLVHRYGRAARGRSRPRALRKGSPRGSDRFLNNMSRAAAHNHGIPARRRRRLQDQNVAFISGPMGRDLLRNSPPISFVTVSLLWPAPTSNGVGRHNTAPHIPVMFLTERSASSVWSPLDRPGGRATGMFTYKSAVRRSAVHCKRIAAVARGRRVPAMVLTSRVR